MTRVLLAREAPRGRRRGGRRLVGLVLVGVPLFGAALGAWGLAAYVRLLRLEVRVTDACARVESAGRERVELATNLLYAAEGILGLDVPPRAALRRAVDRARQQALTSAVLVAPRGPEPFSLAHEALGEALRDVWAGLEASSAGAAGVATRDLRPGLERADASLGLALTELRESLAAYREAREGFPARAVAGWVGDAPPAMAGVGAVPAEAPTRAAAGGGAGR